MQKFTIDFRQNISDIENSELQTSTEKKNVVGNATRNKRVVFRSIYVSAVLIFFCPEHAVMLCSKCFVKCQNTGQQQVGISFINGAIIILIVFFYLT